MVADLANGENMSNQFEPLQRFCNHLQGLVFTFRMVADLANGEDRSNHSQPLRRFHSSTIRKVIFSPSQWLKSCE